MRNRTAARSDGRPSAIRRFRSRAMRELLMSAGLAAGLMMGCRETVFESGKYSADSMWLCKPGPGHNYCLDDLTATEMMPDGSRVVRPFTPAAKPDVDCFYIYPTVDLTGPVGNHTDFSDVSPMLVPLMNQAAWFSGICTVYAPLYRQITILTYTTPQKDRYLEVAYEDVREAFRYYMDRYNRGRRFVLMGHSQGSTMLRMLLQREFDGNPGLRSRLIAALLVGGDVLVPQGQTVGETFQNIPLCTSEEENGCVIAYRSYAAGLPPTGTWTGSYPAGTDPACTNPADLSGGLSYLEASYFPTHLEYSGLTMTLLEGATTPFFLYRTFYTARCARDAQGYSYLEIGIQPVAGDTRTPPFRFEDVPAASLLGLHILDYNFALGDLIRLVQAKARAQHP